MEAAVVQKQWTARQRGESRESQAYSCASTGVEPSTYRSRSPYNIGLGRRPKPAGQCNCPAFPSSLTKQFNVEVLIQHLSTRHLSNDLRLLHKPHLK